MALLRMQLELLMLVSLLFVYCNAGDEKADSEETPAVPEYIIEQLENPDNCKLVQLNAGSKASRIFTRNKNNRKLFEFRVSPYTPKNGEKGINTLCIAKYIKKRDGKIETKLYEWTRYTTITLSWNKEHGEYIHIRKLKVVGHICHLTSLKLAKPSSSELKLKPSSKHFEECKAWLECEAKNRKFNEVRLDPTEQLQGIITDHYFDRFKRACIRWWGDYAAYRSSKSNYCINRIREYFTRTYGDSYNELTAIRENQTIRPDDEVRLINGSSKKLVEQAGETQMIVEKISEEGVKIKSIFRPFPLTSLIRVHPIKVEDKVRLKNGHKLTEKLRGQEMIVESISEGNVGITGMTGTFNLKDLIWVKPAVPTRRRLTSIKHLLQACKENGFKQ